MVPFSARTLRAALCLLLTGLAAPLLAQQTGSISGRVTDSDGLALPGASVEARSEVLPGPRSTVTSGNGEYRLPALPPGTYTVTFQLSGMQTVTRKVDVQLGLDVPLDARLAVGGLSETVEVTAEATLVDRDSSAITTGFSNREIFAIPVGQDYRDLQKLIPAVQYNQDTIRGPSAGGSGQDNVYQFDGVNVTLPLFGTLSSEAASHDIAQFTVVRGGARAVDFERAGGFSMDSVSKSGTSQFHGQLSYQIQRAGMAAGLDADVLSRFEQNRSFLTANLGGPVLKDKLYFYASYYRPEKDRENQANLYGDLPQYESTRNEGFGKLTFTPTNSVLLNVSYRDSKREDVSDVFASNAASTSGTGAEVRLKIATAEGSWVISPRSFASFKLTRFRNESLGRPDFEADVDISTAVGTRLDLTRLDQQGRFSVPAPGAGAVNVPFNTFIQPLIDRYGYVQNGARVGGGIVGFGQQFDDNDFSRDSGEIAYNLTLGTNVTHELHFGYQRYTDSEDLTRRSNGWGLITVPGGRVSFRGTPIFYQAAFQQQTTGAVPTIHSEYQSQNIEVNDTIRWGNWTFNLGVLASNDTLYGQGLREDSSTLTGYVAAPGNQYEMYDVPFSKMIQPRLGATWSYNGKDTIYASFARYNPAASSLPRAASWDRNIATTINAYFDANGVLFATDPVASSSGKLFVEDMTPRRVDEYLVGTARQLNPSLSARLYGRYRRGSHYWEDTNNNARVAFQPPPDIPRELYIADLPARIAQIGSGSSYVIAELDGAFTRFYEATVEADWRGDKTSLRGSYTWSHYYGNFDQDNSTVANDDNIFIGSSFIADAAGRQLWNFREGELRGDRPHLLKVSGFHELGWNATVGVFALFQSGQPWEEWSFEPYRALTTSTSETSRFAEPAGSRRSDSHYQLDLNYTQNFRLKDRFTLQLVGDVFNVFNKQTGYNLEPRRLSPLFGVARSFYDPRRAQVMARLLF
jgi:hypothetical protein